MTTPQLIRFGSEGIWKIFEQKGDGPTQIINNKSFFRTAQASPGLLMSQGKIYRKNTFINTLSQNAKKVRPDPRFQVVGQRLPMPGLPVLSLSVIQTERESTGI